MLNVYAYSYKDTHSEVISQGGVLYEECPKEFKPHATITVKDPPLPGPRPLPPSAVCAPS